MGSSFSDMSGRPRGKPVIRGEFRRNFIEVATGLHALFQELAPVDPNYDHALRDLPT